MIEGKTQKTTVAVGFTGVVYTVQPKFRGPPQNVTFALVNGKQSFNNGDFSINASTGELTLNVAFGSANSSKFARVRMTTDNGASVEKAIKFRSVTDKNPTISGPQEYDGTVTPGDVLATATSTFPDAAFTIAGRESSGTTPATAAESAQAFNIVQTSPTTADVQWSGNVSPSEELDFTIAVTNRDTQGCISGEAISDITFMSSFATCGTPNADPTLFVTVESANVGGQSLFPFSLLGCSFTDGETKEVYSTTYNTAVPGVTWSINVGAGQIAVDDSEIFPPDGVALSVIYIDGSNQVRRGNDGGNGLYNGFIGGDVDLNVVSTTLSLAAPDNAIGPDNYGEAVFNYNNTGNHIRVTIAEGNGW